VTPTLDLCHYATAFCVGFTVSSVLRWLRHEWQQHEPPEPPRSEYPYEF
jgi:hypothetical protein